MQTDNIHTISGTCGGTLLVLLQMTWSGLLQTAVVAAIGATMSFTVSMILKWITGKITRREKGDHGR